MSNTNKAQELANKLTISWENYWRQKISTGKLALYSKFKTRYEMETYLNLRDERLKKQYMRFRTSTHRLQVELGRHSNNSNPDRICNLCTQNQRGDEKHILACSAHTDARHTYKIKGDGEDKLLKYMKKGKLTWMKFICTVMDRADGKKISKPFTKTTRKTTLDHNYQHPKAKKKRNARHDKKKPKIAQEITLNTPANEATPT